MSATLADPPLAYWQGVYEEVGGVPTTHAPLGHIHVAPLEQKRQKQKQQQQQQQQQQEQRRKKPVAAVRTLAALPWRGSARIFAEPQSLCLPSSTYDEADASVYEPQRGHPRPQPPPDVVIGALRRCSLLTHLDENQWLDLLISLRHEWYPPRSHVVTQGERSSRGAGDLFIVHEGRLQATWTAAAGNSAEATASTAASSLAALTAAPPTEGAVVAEYGPGDTFGLLGLLWDCARPESVSVLAPSLEPSLERSRRGVTSETAPFAGASLWFVRRADLLAALFKPHAMAQHSQPPPSTPQQQQPPVPPDQPQSSQVRLWNLMPQRAQRDWPLAATARVVPREPISTGTTGTETLAARMRVIGHLEGVTILKARAPRGVDGAGAGAGASSSAAFLEAEVRVRRASGLITDDDDHSCNQEDEDAWGAARAGGPSGARSPLPSGGASLALKIKPRSALRTSSHMAHALAEIRALGACRHPNVVMLAGAHYDRDRLYIFSEHVPCGTLRTVLNAMSRARTDPVGERPEVDMRDPARAASGGGGGGMPEYAAQFHAACAVLALEHLSLHGIAHRDLRPEALLVDMQGYAKLGGSDFTTVLGRVGGRERTYTLCGSPEYMAPEMLLRCGHDGRVDVWAMGVVLFELLHGAPPFTFESALRLDETQRFDAMGAGRMAPKDFEAEQRAMHLAAAAASRSGAIERHVEATIENVLSQPLVTVSPEHASAAARELIHSLLQRSPSRRPLAPSMRDAAFFEGMDWMSLYGRSLPAPWLPPPRAHEPPSLQAVVERWRTHTHRAVLDAWRQYSAGRRAARNASRPGDFTPMADARVDSMLSTYFSRLAHEAVGARLVAEALRLARLATPAPRRPPPRVIAPPLSPLEAEQAQKVAEKAKAEKAKAAEKAEEAKAKAEEKAAKAAKADEEKAAKAEEKAAKEAEKGQILVELEAARRMAPGKAEENGRP
jgi:serine/threonine protein kinase